MTADELIQILLPLPPDLEIKAWLGRPSSKLRDQGGPYGGSSSIVDIRSSTVDEPSNSLILYVEGEDE